VWDGIRISNTEVIGCARIQKYDLSACGVGKIRIVTERSADSFALYVVIRCGNTPVRSGFDGGTVHTGNDSSDDFVGVGVRVDDVLRAIYPGSGLRYHVVQGRDGARTG